MRARGTSRRLAGALVLALAGPLAGWQTAALGAERIVAPGGGELAAALAAAAPGDVLLLEAGDHAGGVIVDKSLTVTGQAGARIVGRGEGHVITLDAPGIRLEGLVVTGSGLKLETEDSGVFVTERAAGAVVAGNRLDDNLIGVYLKGPRDAVVRGNVIIGRRDLRMNERGNGVQIWRAPGSVVEDNDIRYGRDGIFVTTSKENAFRNNRFRDLRFAVHYMYTNRSEVMGNRSEGNHVGYAIMYSKRVIVRDNRSLGDRDHGILLNYANGATIAGNRVSGGAEKCVFIYNASKNAFRDNRFEGCEIGIHFTAGSERNEISGNAFIANRTQVKYVGSRDIEWSTGGRGNYWSDNLAFDLDGDRIADEPYRPNDLVDQIVWRYPLAKLLLNSPATQILRWAQSAFPALYPGGVTDSHPLMAAPAQERAEADMVEFFALERVGKSYGRKAVLRDIDLAAGGGHCIAVLGHNGAGKTTLMKLLLGLTAPSAGRVSLLGRDPRGRGGGEVRRAVGYLPENIALPAGMTGRELMGFYGGLKRAAPAQCDMLLERVGLAEAARQRVRTYSKGMRQRLGLAQALLGEPRLLFLDEPTNGLDPPLRRQFYDAIRGLTGAGATAVVSSHVLTEIESRADLIVILRDGALVAFGPLDELRSASRLPFRLRLTVRPDAAGEIAETMGGHYRLDKIEAGVMDFVCDGQDKMAILRRVAALNGVIQDVDIVAPRLDEIYAHFVGEVRPS